ncbi:hypothetical protein FDF50_14660 [Clostridium botulinum]|uniref:Uncharacterized protein n=1 Tax=Clostridium botulinum TaxID=1491 RepID=A0A6G4HP81_CLOBO|nr:hypothetical protein [Clostridium botulinum]MBO0571173.1 hypothetical protein [Clostridium botulinum]NFJ62196.1 hypothetical protein [Clostridium botulinum]NFQ62995.1 hypothetical protein [Clostridium botulinum]NFR18902.1 hypothetical protein [Clostridium botulinum]NFU17206.1 hypothetical protein [Clostridium botulinum]
MSVQEFLQGNITSPFDISNFEIVKSINEFNANTKAFFESISNFIYYTRHPKEFSAVVWVSVVKNSFWICMFICLFSVIAHIIGWKKGKLWAKGSIITYIIIMMFNSAL